MQPPLDGPLAQVGPDDEPGTHHDREICDIEDTSVQGANPHDDEVGDLAMPPKAVDEVASGPCEEEAGSQKSRRRGCAIAKNEPRQSQERSERNQGTRQAHPSRKERAQAEKRTRVPREGEGDQPT